MKIFYFSAPWCGQCKVVKPKFEAMCKQKGFDYEIVDCEENEDAVAAYGVRNVPFVVMVDDNDEVVMKGMAADMVEKLWKQ